MKIAVTGHEGYLGSALVKHGYEPFECDITDLDEVNDTLHRVNPDIIINCASITDVDYCETPEGQTKAFAVNVSGVNNLLHSFKGTLVYPSSVHVFNGKKYWDYSENHRPDPLNTYGFTKWAGEQIAKYGMGRSLVIRVSKTFSMESLKYTFSELENGKVEFPTFIKRSFVYLPHFIEGFTWIVENMDSFPETELIHLSGKDTLSYYQFWQFVAEVFQIDSSRIVKRNHEIDLPPRPFRGGLNVSLAERLGVPLYSALEGIREMYARR